MNSNVMQYYEQFPHEMGVNIRELEALLVIKLFWRVSITRSMDIKIITKPPGSGRYSGVSLMYPI
ncbi:hypothetical protein [Peribacillus sp. NPDC096448]|uniref:hypothetical protein n=1 Tax=Peribacillus sp. NPDC096448 TaxID=3364395 RepID=UPI00381DB857